MPVPLAAWIALAASVQAQSAAITGEYMEDRTMRVYACPCEMLPVDANHLEIVGHYRLRDAPKGSARRRVSYRVLKSTPRFEDAAFRQIWTEVFDFSAGAAGSSRLTAF